MITAYPKAQKKYLKINFDKSNYGVYNSNMKGKFLYVKYVGRPRDPSRTAQKGFFKENLAYDEQVSLSTKLTDKEVLEASIILDLVNKKIVRQKQHDFEVSREYDFLYEYFYTNYKKYLDDFLNEETLD